MYICCMQNHIETCSRNFWWLTSTRKYLPYGVSLFDRVCHGSSSFFSGYLTPAWWFVPTFFLQTSFKSLIISVALHIISLNAAIPFWGREVGTKWMYALNLTSYLHRKTRGGCFHTRDVCWALVTSSPELLELMQKVGEGLRFSTLVSDILYSSHLDWAQYCVISTQHWFIPVHTNGHQLC